MGRWGGGLQSGSQGRAWEGREGAGEVEREPSLHHPSRDSSACCFGKKVMINAKVTAIPLTKIPCCGAVKWTCHLPTLRSSFSGHFHSCFKVCGRMTAVYVSF